MVSTVEEGLYGSNPIQGYSINSDSYTTCSSRAQCQGLHGQLAPWQLDDHKEGGAIDHDPESQATCRMGIAHVLGER